MKTLAFVLMMAVAAGVAPTPVVHAADAPARTLTPRQKDQERKAIAAFAAGRYEEAVNIYSELYADFRDPVYLRNIGRCYQKLRNPDKAISSFEEYLARAKRITPAEHDEIRGYIAEMETLRQKQRGETAAPAPTPVDVPAPSLPTRDEAPPAAVAPPPAVVTTTAPAPRSPALRWAAIGTLGAAGVMAIGGGVAMSSAWSKYHAADGKCLGPDACNGAADTVGSRNTLSKVLFVGAAVLGVAGGTLLYLDLSRSDSGSTLVGLGGSF